MITSLCCFILSVPTIWELWDDRKGETLQQKKWDVWKRALWMLIASSLVAFIRLDGSSHPTINGALHYYLDVVTAYALSVAIFLLVFDYSINLILGRKPWYSYLSKSPLDKLWSGWNWKVRMVVRVAVFVGAMVWFYW